MIAAATAEAAAYVASTIAAGHSRSVFAAYTAANAAGTAAHQRPLYYTRTAATNASYAAGSQRGDRRWQLVILLAVTGDRY